MSLGRLPGAGRFPPVCRSIPVPSLGSPSQTIVLRHFMVALRGPSHGPVSSPMPDPTSLSTHTAITFHPPSHPLMSHLLCPPSPPPPPPPPGCQHHPMGPVRGGNAKTASLAPTGDRGCSKTFPPTLKFAPSGAGTATRPPMAFPPHCTDGAKPVTPRERGGGRGGREGVGGCVCGPPLPPMSPRKAGTVSRPPRPGHPTVQEPQAAAGGAAAAAFSHAGAKNGFSAQKVSGLGFF